MGSVSSFLLRFDYFKVTSFDATQQKYTKGCWCGCVYSLIICAILLYLIIWNIQTISNDEQVTMKISFKKLVNLGFLVDSQPITKDWNWNNIFVEGMKNEEGNVNFNEDLFLDMKQYANKTEILKYYTFKIINRKITFNSKGNNSTIDEIFTGFLCPNENESFICFHVSDGRNVLFGCHPEGQNLTCDLYLVSIEMCQNNTLYNECKPE